MKFKFHEGEVVELQQGFPSLGLKAGDTGVICSLYNTDPIAYEVTFGHSEDEAFDMTVTEDDIKATNISIPESVHMFGNR